MKNKQNGRFLVFATLTIVVAVILVIVLLMNIDGSKDKTNDDLFDESPIQNTNDNVTLNTGIVYEENNSPEKDICVVTPYVNLYYPGEWADNVSYEIEETGAQYRVSFYGSVNEIKQLLYTIVIGEKDSYSVCTVKSENGSTVYVGIDIANFEISSKWTNDEADTICAMQEAMNYTLQKLQSEAEYKALS